MKPYSKKILSVAQQVQSYIDAGMAVVSPDEAESALLEIGYYRLRGYCYQFYDNSTKKYQSGIGFSDVLKLYRFDVELSHLLFTFLQKIEISLRSRLSDALLIAYQDALVLSDPSIFVDKESYWKNSASIASEIARSNDVFIKHNFIQHDGFIPLWAAVEVMSFGTLSKTIKNLKTGSGSAYDILSKHYTYQTQRGKIVSPSKNLFSSWVYACSILRNICAHNSRIYNRTINTRPEILLIDRTSPAPRFNGLYQIVLAMKYLRPSNQSWSDFCSALQMLFSKYQGYYDLSHINFPPDWSNHMSIWIIITQNHILLLIEPAKPLIEAQISWSFKSGGDTPAAFYVIQLAPIGGNLQRRGDRHVWLQAQKRSRLKGQNHDSYSIVFKGILNVHFLLSRASERSPLPVYRAIEFPRYSSLSHSFSISIEQW